MSPPNPFSTPRKRSKPKAKRRLSPPFDPLNPKLFPLRLARTSALPPSGRLVFPDAWHPTAPSIGSRRIPSLSRGAFTVTLVDPLANRVVICESVLEARLWFILRIDPQVAWIWEQPQPILYRDEDGTVHRHTFDFLVFLRDGRRIAIAVKPHGKVASSGIEHTLDLIRAQSGTVYADKILLRTEAHITRTRSYNARLIFEAFCERDPEAVDTIAALVRTLQGAVRIGDLIRVSGLEGAALPAIACLIGDGVLHLTGDVRIAPDAFVSPFTAH